MAQSLHEFSTLLWRRGAKSAAKPMALRAYDMRQGLLGPDHPDVAVSLNVLALIRRAEGDADGARPLYERALRLREQVLGADHPDVVLSLNNLGVFLHGIGDYAAAQAVYERSLALRERQLGPDHLLVAASLVNLAELLKKTRQRSVARRLLERCLLLREARLGASHPEVATTLLLLAEAERRADSAAARAHVERAVAIRAAALGPEHAEVGRAQVMLAELLRKTDSAAARQLLDQVATRRERALVAAAEASGAADSTLLTDALDARRLEAVVHLEAQDTKGATSAWQAVLRLQETYLGPEHKELASTVTELAHLADSTAPEALELWARALSLRSQEAERLRRAVAILSPDKAQRRRALLETAELAEADALQGVALVLEAQADEATAHDAGHGVAANLVAAQEHHMHALALRQARLPPDHFLVAESQFHVAQRLQHRGDVLGRGGGRDDSLARFEAEALYAQAADLWIAARATYALRLGAWPRMRYVFEGFDRAVCEWCALGRVC